MNNLPLRFVIFGGTGDLVKNKIIPAIFDLYKKDLLGENFEILGVSRKSLSDEEYQNWVKDSLKEKDLNFINKCHYFSADISNIESLDNLVKELNKKAGNNLYYLAISPNLYENAFKNIATSGLMNPENGWDRVLVEKPFGNDLAHAKSLDRLLGELFTENQIFRIDHYLGKEILQNILVFRFANAIFEPIWNSDSIEEINVEIFESVDVDGRGSFYDSVGALRDVGQNHILQMLALVMMEDPKYLSVDEIRDRRAAVLEQLEVDQETFSMEKPERLIDAPRAQYQTYTDIPNINPDSKTETFFSVKAKIKNLIWENTRINLISGKALKSSHAKISVVFKEKYTSVCPPEDNVNYQNIITFEIQPEPKISVQFWHKVPGLDYKVKEEQLFFKYDSQSKIPDAYEKVLYDAIQGDQTSFVSTREISAQWKFIEKILDNWQKTPILKYKKGIDPREKLDTI